MYPLNVSLPSPQIGFAVANDADEHARLTAMGYEPALEDAAPQGDEEQPTPLQHLAPAPDGAAPTEAPKRGRPRKA